MNKKDDITTQFLTWYQTPRPLDAHKGTFGHVVVVGGDAGMWGATALCAKAALVSGAGKVTVATHPLHAPLVTTICPEIISIPVNTSDELISILKTATVVVAGPGMGQSDWSTRMMETLLKHEALPMVLDAGALPFAAGSNRKLPNAIMTPHVGEASRMLGISKEAIQSDRAKAVTALYEKTGAVSVLKGHGTLVYEGNALYTCPHGGPHMASAGMGDVLSGVIAGLCAQGLELSVAARFGVIWHALCADHVHASTNGSKGKRVVTASALVDQLQNIF